MRSAAGVPPGSLVTTAPVIVNLAEARLGIPLHKWKLELALRAQDDQPRPDHGATGAAEAELSYNF